MANYGELFSDVGGAVSDLFSAIGSGKAASTYKSAALLEQQNVQYEKENVNLEEFQARRRIEQGLGKEQAQVAGAGFANSGTALDLMRSSVEEGALQQAQIGLQGKIQENAYAAQGAAYTAQANAASTAQTGGFFGALIKGAGALFSLF